MTGPREQEPPGRGNEDPQQDGWEALMEAAHYPDLILQCEGVIWGWYPSGKEPHP